MIKQNLTASQLNLLKTGGKPRSAQWNKVRDEYLAAHPKCIVCSTTEKIQIHHMYPFNYCIDAGRPDLELDSRNFISLCEDETKQNHHLLVGHLDSWESYNPNVKHDVVKFKNMTDEQIQSNAEWKSKKANRPKPYKDMNAAEKTAFRQMLDKVLPKK